jgi:hypothetical protein
MTNDAINQFIEVENPVCHGAVIDTIRKFQAGRLLDIEQMACILDCSVNRLENLILNGGKLEERKC